jgi:RNA polymerase sigma-70 factor (ECF subfamily)
LTFARHGYPFWALIPESDDHPLQALLVQAREGDVSAFEALVEASRDQVYGLALRMMGNEADAAEVLQETYLSAYQGLANFRGDAAFTSWVYRIAANFCLMRLRHRKVRAAAEEALAEPEFTPRGSLAGMPSEAWGRSAEDVALDAELRACIQGATDALPETYRQVFVLKDVEGLSYEDIAEVTGDSVAAIKSRLHRSRLALREAIDRFYSEKGLKRDGQDRI